MSRTTIFYFWAFYTFKRQGVSPGFFNAFFLGIFIAVVICFVANSFVKISMHTTGLGRGAGFPDGADVGQWAMNVSVPLALAFVLRAGRNGKA